MKSQFLKPLEDVSLSRSASSTVLVPEGRIQQGRLFQEFPECVRVFQRVCVFAHF